MSEQTPLILSGKTVAKATLMRTRQKVQAMLAEGKNRFVRGAGGDV